MKWSTEGPLNRKESYPAEPGDGAEWGGPFSKRGVKTEEGSVLIWINRTVLGREQDASAK